MSLPRLSRFDNVIDHVSCRVHLRGRADRVTYPVNTFISADKDSIYIEADDPILSELPHQLYNLNALTFPRKNMTARSEDALAEDTVYVGARLSLEDPNNIRFRSSFNVGANSIGAGTEEDPWIIASGDDFMMRVSDPMTRGETHEGKFFEITRNINLNTAYVTAGKGWEPAGHNNINGGSTDFNGTINGCDNYIENLICFTDAGCGGLFYSLGESAYIHNLEMRRVMLNGDSDVGSIASTSKNGCRLDSLSVNGTIEANENAGGFIGRGEVKIKCCISSVNMSTKTEGEGKFIGGMIGQTDNSTFTDCIRTGKIDAPNADYVGGYTGGSKTTKNAVQTTYTRCYVSGSVIGSSDVGGFAGKSCADFTNCHAAATLPVGSYTYTVQWDIFNVNNRMTPMPLEVKANDSNAGGFVGTSHYLLIHGENSFAYSSPAKPNVIGVSGGNVGALAGWCDYRGDANATFTSNAYVQGPSGSICTGGIAGYLENYGDGGTFVNNGNVIGGNHTGGVIGGSNFFGDGNPIQISCKNYGNVKGEDNVGGVIGNAGEIDGADLENYGNVEGTGNCVGGLIGKGSALKFGEDCRVGTENGSLKISGAAEVGGLCGHIEADNTKYLIERYCPVYANIISSAGTAGGLIGYLKVDKNGTESCEIFKNHSPVHVSISVESGDKAGGVIGSLEITANEIRTTNYYGDCISRLKAFFASLPGKLSAAKAKKGSYSANMPTELRKGGKWPRGDDYEYSREFFDLIDPKKPIPLTIHKKNGNDSYHSALKGVVLDMGGTRSSQSPYYRRALIYHEFGHGIDYQRGLRHSKEVKDLRDKQIARLREKVETTVTKRKWDPDKKEFVTETKKTKLMKAKVLSERLDRLYRKIYSMDDATFTKRGITKHDVIEQIAAVQDTLKSLIVSVGWGHSTSYFKGAGKSEAEYLAHCFENAFIGNRVFQKYLPTEYAEMIAFIRSLK